jgi:hypothetical protein
MTNLSTIIKSVRETYEEEINSVKEDLIIKISNEYNLDINYLKSKYLKYKKKQTGNDVTNDDNSDSEYMPSLTNDSSKQILLYKTEYNNKSYYIEMIEHGNVYDSDKNIVGKWSNGIMELDPELLVINKTDERCSSVQSSVKTEGKTELTNSKTDINTSIIQTNNDKTELTHGKKLSLENDVDVNITIVKEIINIEQPLEQVKSKQCKKKHQKNKINY